MKNEFKRIDQDITGMVTDIPAKELKKIYFNKYKDMVKTLFIMQDKKGFESKIEDLKRLIQRMNPEQRRACIGEDVKAYHAICYDLRILLRSEALFGLSTMFAYIWLIGSVKDDLKSYKRTGDQHYFDSAYKLINETLDPFYEKYASEEGLNDIKGYLDRMEDATELTPDDMERLDILKDWVRICGLYAELKDAKKRKNG